MKKIFFFFYFTLLVFANASSQWTVVTQIPTNPNINVISVVNQDIIWVCCDNAGVYKTTNGGLNWVLRNGGLPTGNLYGISALDTTNCWVGNETGSIYKTSNGGINWTLQITITGSFTNGLKMFNANYGVYQGDPTASGQPYQFRYTTNGGTNWLLSPGSPISNNEYGVVNAWDWIDTAQFWIGAANVTANASSTRVFRTSNGFGGGGWNSALLNGTGTSQGLYYQGVAFINANSGVVGSNGSTLRKTTDGGVTWSVVNIPSGVTGSFATNNMNGRKDGTNTIRLSLITGGSNKCFSTTNLGSTWTEEILPVLGQVNGIQHMQFLSSTLGFAGGDLGVFMRYGNPVGINSNTLETPGEYILEQNFPNPFNPSTTIKFSIPKSTNVTLKIYNALGKEVETIVDEFKNAGNYSYEFNAASDLTSGIYFYTLNSAEFSDTKKIILIK